MGGFWEFLKNASNSSSNNSSKKSFDFGSDSFERTFSVWMKDRQTGKNQCFYIKAKSLMEAKNIAVRDFGHSYTFLEVR